MNNYLPLMIKTKYNDKDKIKKQIDSYIFHYVDFDIYKSLDQSTKKSFIVFDVKEAIEFPLLTKYELKIKRGNIFETEIEPNCIYSRSLSGDNSSEKITQSELNEILSHSYQLKYSKNAINELNDNKKDLEKSSDNTNKSKNFSLLLNVVIRILSSIRQYDRKHGDSLSMMKSSLKLYEEELQMISLNNEDIFSDDLKANIQNILNGLESANNHQMFLGTESWNEYKRYIEAILSASEEVLNTFKKDFNTSNLDIDQNIKEQFKYIKNWLQKYNQFKYKEYLSKSYEFSNISLQLGYYSKLAGDNREEKLLEIGDTFLKHSMGQTNVDFMEVEKDIPILISDIDNLLKN